MIKWFESNITRSNQIARQNYDRVLIDASFQGSKCSFQYLKICISDILTNINRSISDRTWMFVWTENHHLFYLLLTCLISIVSSYIQFHIALTRLMPRSLLQWVHYIQWLWREGKIVFTIFLRPLWQKDEKWLISLCWIDKIFTTALVFDARRWLSSAFGTWNDCHMG